MYSHNCINRHTHLYNLTFICHLIEIQNRSLQYRHLIISDFFLIYLLNCSSSTTGICIRISITIFVVVKDLITRNNIQIFFWIIDQTVCSCEKIIRIGIYNYIFDTSLQCIRHLCEKIYVNEFVRTFFYNNSE
jgi:hypothetical protein